MSRRIKVTWPQGDFFFFFFLPFSAQKYSSAAFSPSFLPSPSFLVSLLPHHPFLTSLVGQWWRICLPTQEMWVLSLGQKEPLEEEMTTHSSILAWRIPWREEPGGIQFMGSQRVRYNLATKHHTAPPLSNPQLSDQLRSSQTSWDPIKKGCKTRSQTLPPGAATKGNHPLTFQKGSHDYWFDSSPSWVFTLQWKNNITLWFNYSGALFFPCKKPFATGPSEKIQRFFWAALITRTGSHIERQCLRLLITFNTVLVLLYFSCVFGNEFFTDDWGFLCSPSWQERFGSLSA